MGKMEPENSAYGMGERRGAFVAHASTLLVGLPITFILLPVPLSLVPCPVVAYLLARAFRRRGLAWGAFQGIQASVVQALILLLATVAVVANLPSNLALAFGTAGFLLFLYSIWAAVDTILGYDFNYFVVSNFLKRVSQANLRRNERAGRGFGGGRG